MAALALLLLMAPAPASAYRPMQTEDAYVAELRRIELETSWEHLRWPDGTVDDQFLAATIFGAAPRLELALETPALLHRPNGGPGASGLGDLTAVAKILLLPETASRPSILVKALTKFDNADGGSGLGSGFKSHGLAAVASKDLGDRLFHAMAGYALLTPRDPRRVTGAHFFGLAGEQRVRSRLWAVAEVAGGRRAERDGLADPISGFLGVIFEVSKSLRLDAGLRRGFSRAAAEWQIPLGLSKAF